MRYWNAWGHEHSEKPTFSDSARLFLKETLGEGNILPEATLDEVCRKVPPSRLPEHPLIDRTAEVRVRHARGQSFPDWVAMKSGDFDIFPDGVAFPETPEQIRALMAMAVEHDYVLIPYGGGSSVLGHINPPQHQKPVLTVSLAHMTKLVDLDEHSQVATFGPGTPGPMVEAQLAARGYTLGHFPQSFELSTLGGWVASRSSGQQSLRYGRMEQLFVGGKMETFAGTLDMPVIPASAAGPDIKDLVLGSEGRLGIISEVKVKVSELPEREDFVGMFFPGWAQAFAFAREAAQSRIPLSMLRVSNAVETFSQLRLAGHDELISLMENYLKLRGLGEGKCMVTFAITGTRAQVRSARRETRALIKKYKGAGMCLTGNKIGAMWAKGRFRYPYLRNDIWQAGYGLDTMETSVVWGHVEKTIEAVETALRDALIDEGETVHAFTHLSHVYLHGSSVYTTYLFRLGKTPQESLARWHKLKQAGAAATLSMGGTISHQHGVGKDHAPYLYKEKGRLGMDALAHIALDFDPHKRMNPDVLIEEK